MTDMRVWYHGSHLSLPLFRWRTAHSVCQIHITPPADGGDPPPGHVGTLVFIDLAGSERASKSGTTGQQLKEGSNINKSLSALGTVIAALSVATKDGAQKHVPYRDSVITYLLQQYLSSSDVRVCFLATIAPTRGNFDETLGTLRFVQRACRIEPQTAVAPTDGGGEDGGDTAPSVPSMVATSTAPDRNPVASVSRPTAPIESESGSHDAADDGTLDGPSPAVVAAAHTRRAQRAATRETARFADEASLQRALETVGRLPAAKAVRRYCAFRANGSGRAARDTRARWRRACDGELERLGIAARGDRGTLSLAELEAYIGSERITQALAAFTQWSGKAPARRFLVRRTKSLPSTKDGSGGVTLAQAVVLRTAAWAGPAAVFGHRKYDACYAAMEAVGADVAELVRLGVALKAAWGTFDSALKQFLFLPGGGWDADKLRNPARHDGGRALLTLFVQVQRTEAAALCRYTADVSERAFASVEGANGDGTLPQLVVIAPSGADDIQPLPSVFAGMVFGGPVQFAELDAQSQGVITRAVEIITGHIPYPAETIAVVEKVGGGGVVNLIKGGQLGEAPRGLHIDPSDPAPAWLVKECSPALGSGLVAPLPFLFAEMVLLSRGFHRDIGTLLSPFGTHIPARMKGFNRAWAKCSDPTDGYAADSYSRPESRHLKDLLRCTLLVADHIQLVKAHLALVRKYRPAGTKDRRAEAPRDVLQVVWYKDHLVEIQFHFAAVAAIKKLSHVAYNITRVSAEGAFGAGMETLYSLDDMWGDAGVCTPADLVSRLQF